MGLGAGGCEQVTSGFASGDAITTFGLRHCHSVTYKVPYLLHLVHHHDHVLSCYIPYKR